MLPIEPGTRSSIEVLPRPEHAASALGNAGVDVVATTALILFIEEASGGLSSPYYEDGEATVGVRVEVDHVAPASIGVPVRVSAELLETKGRRLIFANEVHQGDTLVMKGFHHRSVVLMKHFSDDSLKK